MKVYVAYKTELKPNNVQASQLNQAFGGARFAYNWGLAYRKDLYEREKKSINSIGLHKVLNSLKPTEFPWMYESSKCVFQEALRDLDRGFDNFFRNVKQGKKAGFPKFKKKGVSKDSFRLTGSIHPDESSIQLPRLGEIRLKESKYIPFNGKVLSATVSKHAKRYFVSVLVEKDLPTEFSLTQDTFGVDLGIKTLATVSNGMTFENPKAYRKFLQRLKRQQQILSRKQKGSNNRRKQRDKVARLHFKIANIRKDVIHKMTTKLVKAKPAKIVIEDLRVWNMIKNHCLAGAISDAAFGEIRRQLVYKTMWSGIELLVANTFYPSSKTCSKCGHVVDSLGLEERIFTCPVCGHSLDRDFNASINLQNYQPKINIVSSTGIKASGEKTSAKRTYTLRKVVSMNEEHSRVVACQLSTSL